MSGRLIVNSDTAEVVGELSPGDRILRAKSKEFLQSNEKWCIGGFFKGNTAELRLLLPTLSMSERTVLFSLLPYVAYQTCLVRYDNGREIGLKEMVSICNLSKNTVGDAINGLISKDILYRGKNSRNNQYFMNPWIGYKGSTINAVLYEMFKNYYVLSLGAKWKDVKKRGN